MKPLFAVLFLSAALASAHAQPKDVPGEVMSRLGQLNYWSKAPMALMLKCTDILPTHKQAIEADFLKWAEANAEYNAGVEKTLKQFRPYAMKTLGMNADQYEVLTAQAADQQIAATYTQNLPPSQMRQLCGQFNKFLGEAAMGSLVKPRVTMAVADLQKYLYLTAR
jgi:hypothetical protein